MKENRFARRAFLKTAGQSLAAVAALPLLERASAAQPAAASSFVKPAAPARPGLVLNVREFGAAGDGATKDTAALQEAIDRCFVLGGGEVLLPAGNYLTGSIALKSGVTLRFAEGATITGSSDYADYPVTQVRWEGKWVQGHVGLIYAIGAERIGIAGPGKVAGYVPPQMPPYVPMKLRRPVLIEPIACTDVHLEGFSTSYHGMWSIHPTYCERVVARKLTIRSSGGWGDGIDVDSSRQVRIEECDIASGDDCISLKSGRGSEGYLLHRPTEDVHIVGCTFAGSLFACIGIGSETSGGIRGVRIERCKFTHAKTFTLYIKTRPGRGAFIEDIVADDLDVAGTEGGLIRLNLLGSGKQDEAPVPGPEGIPAVRNLRFTNIRVSDAPVLVEGTSSSAEKPVDGFVLSHVTGTCTKGIYLANMRRVVIEQIRVTGCETPLIHTYRVTGTGLNGAAAIAAPKQGEPIPAPAEPYRLH